jgi:hypothetical protein
MKHLTILSNITTKPDTSDRGDTRACNLVIHFSGVKGHKDLTPPEKAWDLFITAEILEKSVLHTNAKTDEYHLHYNFCIVVLPTIANFVLCICVVYCQRT